MILVDTGPLVALFDPRDPSHVVTREALRAVTEPALTTLPVLTEANHLLGPGSRGASALGEMVVRRGLGVFSMDDQSIARAFHLMERWADHPMDLADASLVVAAEATRTLRVLTLDRRDFASYRARLGRSWRAFTLIDPH